jgi:hypothetical protein
LEVADMETPLANGSLPGSADGRDLVMKCIVSYIVVVKI